MNNLKIQFTENELKNEKTPADQLVFGTKFTDHMFIAEYAKLTKFAVFL